MTRTRIALAAAVAVLALAAPAASSGLLDQHATTVPLASAAVQEGGPAAGTDDMIWQ